MQIPVKDIRPNPMQQREKNPDLSDLMPSMEKVGLLQDILVKKAAEGYEIIAGERRWLSACKLGWETVECKVIDVADPKLNIAMVMAENEAREGFTGKERASGFQVMMDLGYSDDEMMAITGAKPEQVQAARKVATAKKKLVAKMPETASLEEMAGLVEFEKDEEAYENLMGNVGTDNFAHRLSFYRQKREDRRKREESLAFLKEQGVRVVDESSTWYDSSTIRLNSGLFAVKIPVKEHVPCPGHCAYVRSDGEVVYCCDKPALHGIKSGNGSGPKTEKQKAEDRLKRQMRALYRASAPVRQEFVVGRLRLKKLDAALFEWAVMWAEKHGVPPFNGYNVKAKLYTESADHRVRFVATAVNEIETVIDNWVKFSGAVGKPSNNDDVVAYLSVLAGLKYPLSDHEKALVAGKAYVPEAKS